MSLSTPLTALTAASTVASIVGKSARAGAAPKSMPPMTMPIAVEAARVSFRIDLSSECALRDIRQAVSGRRGAGAVDVKAAAGRPDANADCRDRRAASTKGQFRAGKTAAEPAEAEIEAADREPALHPAEERVPGLLHEVADLALDRLQQVGRVEQVGDQVEPDPIEEVVEAGQRGHALGRVDIAVVRLDPGVQPIDACLGDCGAAGAARARGLSPHGVAVRRARNQSYQAECCEPPHQASPSRAVWHAAWSAAMRSGANMRRSRARRVTAAIAARSAALLLSSPPRSVEITIRRSGRSISASQCKSCIRRAAPSCAMTARRSSRMGACLRAVERPCNFPEASSSRI